MLPIRPRSPECDLVAPAVVLCGGTRACRIMVRAKLISDGLALGPSTKQMGHQCHNNIFIKNFYVYGLLPVYHVAVGAANMKAKSQEKMKSVNCPFKSQNVLQIKD